MNQAKLGPVEKEYAGIAAKMATKNAVFWCGRETWKSDKMELSMMEKYH